MPTTSHLTSYAYIDYLSLLPIIIIISQLEAIIKMGELITEEGIGKLINLCKMREEEGEMVRRYIKHAKIQTKMIRDVLSEQGRQTKRAFLLLDGFVKISVTLHNGEKAVLSQVGKEQLLNLEIVLSNWTNIYSITVCSSFIKYITFQERQIRLLTQNIIPELQQKATRRQKQVNRRNKQIKQQARKKKLQENINKLILPQINPNIHKRSLININSNHTEQATIKNLPLFSKELKKQGRSSSLSQLKSTESRYSEPISLASKNMEEINQRILDHFHQHRDKIAKTKLQRLKSQRSISLNQKQIKEYDYSRNQKLFKEHLKHIVKRKLMFERKHFKILTNFKNQPKQPREQDEIIKKYEDSPENPIDNYFIL